MFFKSQRVMMYPNFDIRLFAKVAIAAFVLFVLIIFISRYNNVDKTLKLSDAIHLEVVKVKKYKGITTLNDSIAIHAATPRINMETAYDRYQTIGTIPAKYTLSKSANSDSIIVNKDSEMLIYKLFK